jgi:hypothetical protein
MKARMKVGDLVKIMRASIGIPTGTIGLIIEAREARMFSHEPPSEYDITYYEVQLCSNNRITRRTEEDLEAISASR